MSDDELMAQLRDDFVAQCRQRCFDAGLGELGEPLEAVTRAAFELGWKSALNSKGYDAKTTNN